MKNIYLPDFDVEALQKQLQEGEIDPFTFYIELKEALNELEKLEKETKVMILDSSRMCEREEVGNYVFLRSRRTNYNFEHSSTWGLYYSRLKNIEKLMKQAAQNQGTEIKDKETGEIIEPAVPRTIETLLFQKKIE